MQYPAQIQASIDLLTEIHNSDLPADALATHYFRTRRYIGSGDRRVISGLVFAILRHQEKLNWWIEHMGMRGVSKPRVQVMLSLLLLEGKSLEELQDIFSGEDYAPQPITEFEMYGLSQIKTNTMEHPDMPEAVQLDLPQWIYDRLKPLYGDTLKDEMEALQGQAPLDLRVNTLKTNRDAVLMQLEKMRWAAEATPLSPLGVRMERGKPLSSNILYTKGEVEVQDEGSQLIALLADPKPGHAVLDFCAGAGGKTLALAALMENRGRLLATDVAEHRLAKAKIRLRRAGVSNHELKPLNEQGYQWLRRQKGRFDRVIVDAPCSGSGTWRRNPDLKNRFTEQDLNELLTKQAEILDSAASLVKPGGRLVYATCSLYPDENENQVNAFLERHKDYIVRPIGEVWTAALATECPVSTSMLRLSPNQNQTDGFFVAVLEKQVLDKKDSAN